MESVRQKDSHPSPNPPKVLCLKLFWDVRDISDPSLIPHLSLTQLSHSALFVVNMYAITAVWCWYEWYGSVMWVVCERNVRDDVRDEITWNPLFKGVLIEKSEGCWIWSHGCKARTFLSAVLTLATVSPLDVVYIVVAVMKDTLFGSRPSNPMVILQFVLFNNL